MFITFPRNKFLSLTINKKRYDKEGFLLISPFCVNSDWRMHGWKNRMEPSGRTEQSEAAVALQPFMCYLMCEARPLQRFMLASRCRCRRCSYWSRLRTVRPFFATWNRCYFPGNDFSSASDYYVLRSENVFMFGVGWMPKRHVYCIVL